MKPCILVLSISVISFSAFAQSALDFCEGGSPAGRSYPGDLLYPNSAYPHFHCFKGDKVQGNSVSGSEIAYTQAKRQCKWDQNRVDALKGGKPGNLASMVARYNDICDANLIAP